MHKIFLYFAALHYNILMLPIFLSPGTRFVGIECSCPEHGRTFSETDFFYIVFCYSPATLCLDFFRNNS